MNKKIIAKNAKGIASKPVREQQEMYYPNNDLLKIISQAFYGNRVCTYIKKEEIDSFICPEISRNFAHLKGFSADNDIPGCIEVDRTIVQIPNSKCVLVYNANNEEVSLKYINSKPAEEACRYKSLAEIPEFNLRIFSRCIVCGVDENGELCSIPEDDDGSFFQYLAR